MKKHLILVCLMLLTGALTAQNSQDYSYTGQTKNYISTGMPILLISPDAASAAMGDAGVASAPDGFSAHWNNAKYAFIDNKMGASTTYTPWLKNLGVNDMNLLYLSGYYRINDRSAAALSLTYFSLGDIASTDEQGLDLGTLMPNEFAVDATYAMKISDNLSLGATGRYIRDDLTNKRDVEGQSTKTAQALAADIGLYYQQRIDKRQSAAAGLSISNLGSKLSYSDDDTQNEFLPANFRIGGRYTYEPDEFNKLNFLLDLNKLLVPTPPITEDGETYGHYANMTEYSQTGAMQGAINSFFDAPGGFKEELSEINVSVGAEYWYENTFAARLGYFYEPESKGGRQYLTMGVGLRYNVFIFDFAYLVPTTDFSSNPLSNTWRISISLNWKENKK